MKAQNWSQKQEEGSKGKSIPIWTSFCAGTKMNGCYRMKSRSTCFLLLYFFNFLVVVFAVSNFKYYWQILLCESDGNRICFGNGNLYRTKRIFNRDKIRIRFVTDLSLLFLNALPKAPLGFFVLCWYYFSSNNVAEYSGDNFHQGRFVFALTDSASNVDMDRRQEFWSPLLYFAGNFPST